MIRAVWSCDPLSLQQHMVIGSRHSRILGQPLLEVKGKGLPKPLVGLLGLSAVVQLVVGRKPEAKEHVGGVARTHPPHEFLNSCLPCIRLRQNYQQDIHLQTVQLLRDLIAVYVRTLQEKVLHKVLLRLVGEQPRVGSTQFLFLAFEQSRDLGLLLILVPVTLSQPLYLLMTGVLLLQTRLLLDHLRPVLSGKHQPLLVFDIPKEINHGGTDFRGESFRLVHLRILSVLFLGLVIFLHLSLLIVVVLLILA